MVGKDGGKAKPLKAAKKAEKDYDEGACAALPAWPACFHDVLARKRRACGALTRLLLVSCTPDDLAFLAKKKEEAKARSPRRCTRRSGASLSTRVAPGLRGSRRLHAHRTARTCGVRSAAEARALGVPGSTLRARSRRNPGATLAPPSTLTRAAAQAMAALKAKASEKGAFGGKGLSYSGKK